MPRDPLPGNREESIETIEFRKLFDEYDALMELCRLTKLSPEQVKQLDEMYASLLFLEQEYWEEGHPTSGYVVETIRDACDIDFPLIRFQLGLLPGQPHHRSNK